MEFLQTIDQNAGATFQHLRIADGWLTPVMVDVSALGGRAVLLLVVAFTLGLLLSLGRYRTAGFVLVAAIGGLLLTTSIKHVVDRQRPNTALASPLVEPESRSFPSGHSMNSAVVYLTLAMISSAVVRRWPVRLYVVTASLVLVGLIGVSRLFLGVHYLTDVVAGWIIGLCWALICRWIEFRWVMRAERRALASYEPASVLSK